MSGAVDKVTFAISAVICTTFVIWSVVSPEAAGQTFGALLNFFTGNFGWAFMLVVSLFMGFCFWLAFSKYGGIKLGKDDDVPEYSTGSWFAMLFSAGMGIGLVFWSVAEPMFHYMSPPYGQAASAESADIAMRYAFLHWGLHPWAAFAVVGLPLAYFQFRKGLPGLISSCLHPLLGDEGIKGPIGKTVDILAVFATVFGVATSLGLGAMQINMGLNYVYNLVYSTQMTVIIIAIVTVIFVASAVSGIEKGIKFISELNMYLCVGLLLFVMLLGPTRFIFDIFTNTVGSYIANIVQMSFWTDPYNNSGWVGSWTVFYWAWWISWGPFVGGFIARISKGRTVKEFILGVLIVPAVLCFVWLSIFSGTAINVELFGGGGIATAVQTDVSTALFALLDTLPLSAVSSTVAVFLISTFFVTSAQSATFVCGMLTSGGNLNPSNGLKIFWGTTEGLVAAVLLIVGGLKALQTACIVVGFPFMLVSIAICFAIVKAFKAEVADSTSQEVEASANDNLAV